MLRRHVPMLVGLALSLLLTACGQNSGPAQPAVSSPADSWTSTAPQVRPQSLTPGTNTLQYENALLVINGYGPVGYNRSNGERAGGDGHALTLNGKVYPQGYGVHADSELRFSLQGTDGARCTRFTTDVGVDDEVGSGGSVQFQVYLDGTKAYDSGRMTGTSAT